MCDSGGLVGRRPLVGSRLCGTQQSRMAFLSHTKKIAAHAHPYCAKARFNPKTSVEKQLWHADERQAQGDSEGENTSPLYLKLCKRHNYQISPEIHKP